MTTFLLELECCPKLSWLTSFFKDDIIPFAFALSGRGDDGCVLV